MNPAPATHRYDADSDELDRQLLTGTVPDEAFGRQPATPALSPDPEPVDCPDCRGGGEIGYNPSPINDPQCETSARCGRCHGDGAVSLTQLTADEIAQRCIVCGTTPNVRCCEFGRDH